MMMKKLHLLVYTVFLCPMILFAGNNDSVYHAKPPFCRNVIKFNPTPMILWSIRNITFSYERILNPRQSISVEAGYLVMPRVIEDSITSFVDITSHKKNGLSLTAEYRFYLTRLNTRPVPAGLYIGPYLTYYRYHFENGLAISNEALLTNGMLTGDYWSFNGGLELGYQFVFWKRLTLDLVLIGPSISYYGGKTDITGDLNADQIQDINQALYDKILEKFPAAGYLAIDKSYQQTGKLDVLRIGFRYLMQIGFAF